VLSRPIKHERSSIVEVEMNRGAPETSQTHKVSIVLPTYNGVQYLRGAMESCLNQTHSNIELIVVDDGSSGRIREIVSSYPDERIVYVRHPRNMGLPHALNTGFACASGAYLTWTSDDNLYAPSAIQKMLSSIDERCEFVYCDYYRFSRADLSDRRVVKLPDRPALHRRNDIGPCFLYSTAVKELVGGYDPDAALSEDYDYWVRVSRRFRMCHLAEPLYYYRGHVNSLSLSKYYEVKIVGTLVKVKNGLLDVRGATESLLDVESEKFPTFARGNKALEILYSRIIANRLGRKINFQIRRCLPRKQVSASIERIVGDFSMKRIRFGEAKQEIRRVLMKE